MPIHTAYTASSSNGGVLFFPTTASGNTYALTGAQTVTIPSNVQAQFAQGATLSPGSGQTATINGGILAHATQMIFPVSMGGTVALGNGVGAKVSAMWFDALGNGSSDDSKAIYNAYTAMSAAGGVLFFPTTASGAYYKIGTTKAVTIPSTVQVELAKGATLVPSSTVTTTINGGILAHPTQLLFPSSMLGTIVLGNQAAEKV